MSETTAPVAPPTPAPIAPSLPLFFSAVTAVSVVEHASLRIDRNSGYAFAGRAQAIPIGLGEFEAACQHYPIVFTTGEAPTPMALMGLQEGLNLFVQPDGAWRADTYVPAYPRAYPFIFVEDRERQTMVVGMDPNAKAISAMEGAAMFEDGKPSPAMNETVAFCAAFRDSLNAGIAFGRAMQEAGLLAEEEANISFTAGGAARVTGFKVLKADRLETIDDATWLDWRRRGWIAAIYAHLHSAGRWARLVELSIAA